MGDMASGGQYVVLEVSDGNLQAGIHGPLELVTRHGSEEGDRRVRAN